MYIYSINIYLYIYINTPTHLERSAPSSLSSSACGCSAWTLCPASWPELASAGFLQHTGSSAPSASSHTETSTPGAIYRHDMPTYNCTLSTPQILPASTTVRLFFLEVGVTYDNHHPSDINFNNSTLKSLISTMDSKYHTQSQLCGLTDTALSRQTNHRGEILLPLHTYNCYLTSYHK